MKQLVYFVILVTTVTFMKLLGVTPEQLDTNVPLEYSTQKNVHHRDTKSATLTAFLQLLQEYRLNAPWITEELLELSVDDFEQAFAEVIGLLTQAEKRWFYFCDKPQDYDQDVYWQQCLWQCMYYVQWLEKLYVLPDGELFYKETDITRVPMLACLYTEYIDKKQGEHALCKLYAFYADCLAHFFCFSVDYAARSRDNGQIYIACWLTGKLCLERLEKIIEYLKDTSWYGPYYLSLKRYQEVYALLDEEFLRELE